MIIKIHRYSGHPNPKFTVSAAEESLVIKLLPENTQQVMPDEHKLGFRHVTITYRNSEVEGGFTTCVAKNNSVLEDYCLLLERKYA